MLREGVRSPLIAEERGVCQIRESICFGCMCTYMREGERG